MASSSASASSSSIGSWVLLALVVAVVAPFLVLDAGTACPVAAAGSQLVLLLGLVLHGLHGRSSASEADEDGTREVLTRDQRTFRDRVDASRHRFRELYAVVAKEPPSHGTHDGMVYEAPDGDVAVTLGPRGLRQDDAWLLWSDVLDVGVVVDGAARLEVLTPDGIRALWLAKASRTETARLLWMVGEIRRHASDRRAQDEGAASEVPQALRALQQRPERSDRKETR